MFFMRSSILSAAFILATFGCSKNEGLHQSDVNQLEGSGVSLDETPTISSKLYYNNRSNGNNLSQITFFDGSTAGFLNQRCTEMSIYNVSCVYVSEGNRNQVSNLRDFAIEKILFVRGNTILGVQYVSLEELKKLSSERGNKIYTAFQKNCLDWVARAPNGERRCIFPDSWIAE